MNCTPVVRHDNWGQVVTISAALGLLRRSPTRRQVCLELVDLLVLWRLDEALRLGVVVGIGDAAHAGLDVIPLQQLGVFVAGVRRDRNGGSESRAHRSADWRWRHAGLHRARRLFMGIQALRPRRVPPACRRRADVAALPSHVFEQPLLLARLELKSNSMVRLIDHQMPEDRQCRTTS